MSSLSIRLPTANNIVEAYSLVGTPVAVVNRKPSDFNRQALAAAHLVTEVLAERDPWDTRPVIDWDATLGFRHWLWDQGLGLAEAMDTAQRGMGVDWETAKELIQRTMRDAKARSTPIQVACGAGTDHCDPLSLTTADDITAAYETQMEAIEAAGGQVILMASRALTLNNMKAQDYHRVYRRLIDRAADPVILHWLGDMFDPNLAGYWGSRDIAEASDLVINLITENPGKVDGIKISLLDQAHEESFRRRLPVGVKLYTGDDFNYPDLIAGDGEHHSHALLGIFAAIAPAASHALECHAKGNMQGYFATFNPTIALAREIFRAPTRFYKAGIAYLSWLNGLQSHFVMPQGFQSSRDITHYANVFRLADQSGMLADPELAVARMNTLLALYGVE